MGYFGIPFRNGVPIGLGSVVSFGAQQFDPSELFVGGTAGAWYDPSDLTTLFTTSAGTTPVAMPGLGSAVSVGLMLDKSQGLVLGANIQNGGFDTDTIWTKNGWVISGGTASYTGAGAAIEQASPVTLAAGDWVRVTVTISAITSGFVYAWVAGGVTSALGIAATRTNSAGTYTWYFPIATVTNQNVGIYCGNSPAGIVIDNVTIQRISGNHAIAFNDTTARPELRARVNLLTYSEEFDNGAWGNKATLNTSGTPAWVNVAVAPDGTTTAEKFIATAVNNFHGLTSGSFAPGTYTISVYAKAAEYSKLFVGTFAGATISRGFDLTNGTTFAITGATVPTSWSMTDAGNGWWRCSVTVTTAGADNVLIAALTSASLSFTGDGTSGVLVWGADLRPANIGANVPAYQRIADANTYDTSGFPLYLRFDGIDDSMYTPANLNLSGTDKVSVFAGVRKLSDAAAGMVTELASFLLNGTFNLAAPSANVALGANFGPAVRGNGATSYGEDAGSNPAPRSAVLTSSYDLAAVDKIDFRINGATASVVNNGGAAGTGNFGAYPLFVGARNNNSVWLNGHLHSLIIAGSAVSASNISATEQWVAGKTGIAIP